MITLRHPGTVLTDRFFSVPLDHQRPDGEQIEVFAREVVAADKADADLPWLLFLQAVPGSGRSGPKAGKPGWTARSTITGCCCSTSVFCRQRHPPAGARGAP